METKWILTLKKAAQKHGSDRYTAVPAGDDAGRPEEDFYIPQWISRGTGLNPKQYLAMTIYSDTDAK